MLNYCKLLQTHLFYIRPTTFCAFTLQTLGFFLTVINNQMFSLCLLLYYLLNFDELWLGQFQQLIVY